MVGFFLPLAQGSCLEITTWIQETSRRLHKPDFETYVFSGIRFSAEGRGGVFEAWLQCQYVICFGRRYEP